VVYFLWILQVAANLKEKWICLKLDRPRGCFLLGGTGSAGEGFWSVGSKLDLKAQITSYPSGYDF
jgi:hypothetical protein